MKLMKNRINSWIITVIKLRIVSQHLQIDNVGYTANLQV